MVLWWPQNGSSNTDSSQHLCFLQGLTCSNIVHDMVCKFEGDGVFPSTFVLNFLIHADQQFEGEALEYHARERRGKVEVVSTKPSTQRDLAWRTVQAAEPCKAIADEPQDVYKYTAKGNLVAVISNGTAVLGLGDIGPEASKPVMEGKGVLFKVFADIDVFDIEVDATDVDHFVATVKAIAPTFGGINLEDIKAPEAFEIERRLKEELDIPLMHDDQHGTAIISAAALVNALKLADKHRRHSRCGERCRRGKRCRVWTFTSSLDEAGECMVFDSRGHIHAGRRP